MSISSSGGLIAATFDFQVKHLLQHISKQMQQHYPITPADSCLHYTIFASNIAGIMAFAFIPSLTGVVIGTLALSAGIAASASCFYSHPELPKDD